MSAVLTRPQQRCDRCHHWRAVQPWTTTSGLVFGRVCEPCRMASDRQQRKTERALSDNKPERPKALRRSTAPRRIAAALLAQPDLLGLRAGRLVRDVLAVYPVGACTARTAVALARRNAGIAG